MWLPEKKNYEDVRSTFREFTRRAVVVRTLINSFRLDGLSKTRCNRQPVTR